MITIDSLYDLYKTDYDTLLNGVIFIHIIILALIFRDYLKNPNSIYFPVTRIQLVLLILSLWIFIIINNNDLKEKYNDY